MTKKAPRAMSVGELVRLLNTMPSHGVVIIDAPGWPYVTGARHYGDPEHVLLLVFTAEDGNDLRQLASPSRYAH